MKLFAQIGFACLVLALLAGQSLASSAFHVTPSGQASGSGSSSSPWDLRSALNQPSAVNPGDTIWIHGGTYSGTFSTNLNGTSSQPIIVRNWNNERATIDGGNSNGAAIFTIGGSYTWYWGLEITSSTTNKISTQVTSWPTDIMYGEGVEIKQGGTDGTGCKFINIVVHDTRQGFSSWKEAANSEVYGCVVYDNGWLAPDRPHGHNMYIQNVTGTKLFSDNFILRAYSHNIQSYGSTASNEDNETFVGNVGVNGGERNFMIGGDNPTQSPVWQNNVMYSDGSRAGSNNFYLGYPIGYNPGTFDAVVTGNYFAGGGLTFNTQTNLTFSGNLGGYTSVDGGGAPNLSGQLVSGKPATDTVIIRLNKYESARANLVVFNWKGQNAVNVDLSSVVGTGQPYVIRDAQNYYGTPVASGTYAGGTVSIPMTGGTVPATVGNDPRGVAHTAQQFGTFVIFGSGAGVIVPNVSGALSVTPTTLPAGGGQVTLSWSSQNATSASFDNGIGTVATSGSRTVTVTATTTFTLTLAGHGGPVTSQVTVQVAQAQLAGPVLSSPLNGSTGLPTTIILGWNGAQGATGYELQLAADSTFSTLVYSNASVTGTTDQVSALTNGLRYYWRVRGKNASGNGSYSAVWHFSTLPPDTAGPATLPLVLFGTSPESLTVNIAVTKPAGAAGSLLVLNVYDADGADEGAMYVNGTLAAGLFGAQAVPANDAKSALVTLPLSPDLWKNGPNQIRFAHLRTAGYRIDNIGVSFSVNVQRDTTPTAPHVAPKGFSLYQNYPNPFNPATTIRYSVPFTSRVRLEIFNVLGQTVEKLVDEEKPAGVYSVQFNGSAFPSGVYYCQLLTNHGLDLVKMVLVR
jgi:hypothetical protein